MIPQHYATVSKFGKKVFVVGDSHFKGIKRLDFNKELCIIVLDYKDHS